MAALRWVIAVTAILMVARAEVIPDRVNVIQLDDDVPTDVDTSFADLHVDTSFADLGEGAEVGAGEGAKMLVGQIAAGSEEQYTTVEDAAGAGTCGNGLREGGEECDDGNTAPNDGCNSVCKVEGGYQCTPITIGGNDTCTSCGDTQCTTFFGRQSRCLDTIATREQGGAQGSSPVDAGADSPALSFLQTAEGGQGAYARGSNGFCVCAAQWCKLPQANGGPMDFTCQSTEQGWARKNLTDDTCTCGTGFCSMPLGGAHTGESQCVPLHANMIADQATGQCQCRPETAEVNSTDPMLARPYAAPACKILPVEPVVRVKGGADKFGQFECVGAPYIKDDASDRCIDCSETGACKVPRTGLSGASNNFLCFTASNGTADVSGPYKRKADGMCECGQDQCMKPKGDHFVCRDLTGAMPYGPNKQADGKCGCSANKDVCRVDMAGDDFRCVHMATDNFAANYRKAHDGKCDCKFGFCQAPNDPETGRPVCRNAQADSPYQRKSGSLKCECKPGSCQFPGGICKKCPVIPGQCETHCHNTTSSMIECTKFCRTSEIALSKARATAQGQMQSVTETIAREIGCFVEKVTECTVSTSSKKCTQKKSAKALYDCPAAKMGDVPLRLSDGTETHGYRSICGHDDLECQIQNCGRNPDSQKCMAQAMLV